LSKVKFINVHTHHSNTANAEVMAIRNFYWNQMGDNPIDPISLSVHPWYLPTATTNVGHTLLSLIAKHPTVKAIGECGLDKFSSFSAVDQRFYFEQCIAIANQTKLPLIVHCVRRLDEVLGMLKNSKVPVLFHGFNNEIVHAKKIIDHGYMISLGPAIFKNAGRVQGIFKTLNLSHIMLETDHSPIAISSLYDMAVDLGGHVPAAFEAMMISNYKKIFDNNG
jgi:TatD DNase family protein